MKCAATTQAGTGCKFNALEGSAYCRKHLSKPAGSSTKPARSSTKPARSSTKMIAPIYSPPKLPEYKLKIVIDDFSEEIARRLSKILVPIGKIDGSYGYKIIPSANIDYYRVFRILGDIPATALFKSPSGRDIEIPTDLFGDKTKISGPICLQTVKVGKRIYNFFGDLHESTDEMCPPETSQTIQEIIKSFADLPEGPSLDVFTEISKGRLPSSIGPLSEFITKMIKCMRGKNMYTAKHTEICGLNTRYHWSDIRQYVPESRFIRFNDSKNTFYVDNENIEISLRSTMSILEGLLKISGLLRDYLVSGDDRHEQYLRYLDRYLNDSDFRDKNNLIALDILSLPRGFVSVFSEGRVIPGEYENFAHIIYKQTVSCDPQYVKKIFEYISNNICRIMIYFNDKSSDIFSYMEEIVRMRKEALSDPIKTFLSRKTEIQHKDPLYRYFFMEMVDASYVPEMIPKFVEKFSNKESDIPFYTKYIKNLLDSGKSSIEVFDLVSRVAASTFVDRSLDLKLTPYYAMYMDLFTLLRIERTYSKPREMKDPSGGILSMPSYYSRRPTEVENVIVYAGSYHTINYANYFIDKREGKMIGEYPSHTDRKGMGMISYVTKIAQTVPEFRCIKLKAPISTLFIPLVALDEIVVKSDFQLF